MLSENNAIKVQNVSKFFILPSSQASSVKGIFTGLASGYHKSDDTKQQALNGIDFEVKQGEFFGIVGRNGSGKSTLLKILAGIYQPSDGKVETTGKLVPFIELGVGFNPELSGRDNVYLNGAMLGFSKKEVDAMYDDIVSFAELEKFMEQKLKNYSSGMQVRLAFSMATQANADVLLIDEVLAVGDADFQRKCFEYFKQLKRDKVTVVFVSHDMEAVREYCDRAVLIENSEIIAHGTAAEVAKEYTKLFMVDNAGQQKDTSGNRWGDQAAMIADISATVTTKEITLTQIVRAQQPIEQPIVGFRIRDAVGKEVTGTNTKVEHQSLPSLQPGEAVQITWRLPNILSDGQYTVDPAVLHGDGITVADWWDDALKLKIKKSRHLPYAIDPSFKLEVKTRNVK
jgi:ABC-2 type transport system ATP-binding protein